MYRGMLAGPAVRIAKSGASFRFGVLGKGFEPRVRLGQRFGERADDEVQARPATGHGAQPACPLW